MHTHHSHSGQFCSHGQNTLDQILAECQRRRFKTICLTEHVARLTDSQLYPEEVEAGERWEDLIAKFDRFVDHARLISHTVDDTAGLSVLVGFETEWIDRDQSAGLTTKLVDSGRFDMFVGSLHHVHTIPIDFDAPTYHRALSAVGSTGPSSPSSPEAHHDIFAAYFDAQLDMITTLRPPVVGHFDLIRLFAAPSLQHATFDIKTEWPDVWDRIIRNLDAVAAYDGLLELNSSALRKNLAEPYPQSAICREWVRIGGRFVLSDDSHSVEQVGTNYHRLVRFISDHKLDQSIVAMERRNNSISVVPVPMADLEEWVRIDQQSGISIPK